MYLIDYHMHSKCSHDGHVSMREMAEAALERGMQEICITDHCDLLDGQGGWSPPFPWEPLLEQYREAREGLKGRLTVKLGIELGNASEDPAQARSIAARPELDFIIGSIHSWAMKRGGTDYYFGDYHTKEACEKALADYFEQMEAVVGLPETFDVLGHIIYPIRYMNRDGQYPTLDSYEERVRAILRRCVEQGKGMEVNTYRGRTIGEWRQLLGWYKECGGEIITVGSDAHQVDQLAGEREAYALLEQCGFRYVTVFSRRKPEMIAL